MEPRIKMKFMIVLSFLCVGFAVGEDIDEPKLYDAIANFGFALTKRLNEVSPRENTFISPLSIHTALSMAMLGSKEKTRMEMTETLALGNFGEDELRSTLRSLIARKHTGDENDFKMQLANRMFVSMNRPVKETFRSDVQKTFDADAVNVDYAQNGSAVLDGINDFVKQKTFGLIKKLLDAPLDSETIVTSVNTLYFKGLWTKLFTKLDTPSTFNKGCKDLEKKSTKWLTQTETLSYYNSSQLNAELVRIPYVSRGENKVEMLIVLPHKAENNCQSTQWFQSLTWDKLKGELPKTQYEPITLTIPEFEVSSKVRLEEILPSMGMKSAFEKDTANFSGISDKKVLLDKVIHAAKMVVTENGTEAAAATVVSIVEYMMLPRLPKFVLKIDRSFYVSILYTNKESPNVALPLFTGVVNRI